MYLPKLIFSLSIIVMIAIPSAVNGKQMSEKELQEFAIGYAAAWSSQVPEKLAAHYAENGYIIVNGGTPSAGRAQIAQKAQGFMTAFPDMVVTLDKLEIKGEQVVFNWHWVGTNTGPGGTGKRLDIRGYETWTLNEDGLIKQSLGTYNRAEYEKQMGLTKD